MVEQKERPLYPFAMVFGGCISSIVFLEYLFQLDSGCGNLVSFTDFLFVLLQSLPQQFDFRTWRARPRLASWRSHVVHGGLWVTMSILVNYAYAFDISIPIHTLFRSCNIISSVALGWLCFGQTYVARELASVGAVTVGLVLATLGEAEVRIESSSLFALGIAVLSVVLVLQACLGHVQHGLYKQFDTGKPGARAALADEFCFYSHVLSLAPMVLLVSHLRQHLDILLATAPLHPSYPVPAGMVWLCLNLLMQAACIKGVFYLSASYSPLTVNLTLSVRKFVSVLFSVWWFNNPWNTKHLVATFLIFGGVLIYFRKDPPKQKAS